MIKQIYSKYTEEDHRVWTALFSRIMLLLPETADKWVLEGLKKMGFPSDHIPDFHDINKRISTFTDWEIVPLETMVEDNEFIGMLADNKYPCRTWIRTPQQLEAEIDEYDIFHDVIGHTPLLTRPNYCNYLRGLGKLAQEYIDNKKAISLLKRVYWHTIQFGLKASNNDLKIYGAHLLSSRSETIYCFSAGVPKYDFNVAKIMDTPYVNHRFQEKYFTINNFEQLFDNLDAIKAEIEKRLDQ